MSNRGNDLEEALCSVRTGRGGRAMEEVVDTLRVVPVTQEGVLQETGAGSG